MNLDDLWALALKKTEILRSRIQPLMTFQSTAVSYILLSESTVNLGDTVVRKGEVLVDKPAIILPPNIPQFLGFEFEEEKKINENSLINFLLVRGIAMPSLKYNNKTQSLDVFEGDLEKAVKHYRELLQQQENVNTGLLAGPEECWQFSILLFICSQAARNADVDLKNLMKEFKKKDKG